MTPREEIAARYGIPLDRVPPIRVIPRGVSAFEVAPIGAPTPLANMPRWMVDAHRCRRAAQEKRMERVAQLADGTRTIDEIAATVGAGRKTVEKDLTSLRQAGGVAKIKPVAVKPAAWRDHVDAIAALVIGGETIAAAAARFGITPHQSQEASAWIRAHHPKGALFARASLENGYRMRAEGQRRRAAAMRRGAL